MLSIMIVRKREKEREEERELIFIVLSYIDYSYIISKLCIDLYNLHYKI